MLRIPVPWRRKPLAERTATLAAVLPRLTAEEREALRGLERTLHRLDEYRCGVYEHTMWGPALVLDETDDEGRHWRCHYHDHHPERDFRRRLEEDEDEDAVTDRIAAILSRHNAVFRRSARDPRGPVGYAVRRAGNEALVAPLVFDEPDD